MWREASRVILFLYVLCAAYLLLVAWAFSHDAPLGVWIGFLPFILGMGVGMLCIYLSIQFLRRESILKRWAVAPAKLLFALVALVLGWLTLIFFLGLNYSTFVDLVTDPGRTDRRLQWGAAALLFGWMLVGLLDRHRAAGSVEA